MRTLRIKRGLVAARTSSAPQDSDTRAAAASEHPLDIELFHAFNGEKDSAEPVALKNVAFASDRLPEYLNVAVGALRD